MQQGGASGQGVHGFRAISVQLPIYQIEECLGLLPSETGISHRNPIFQGGEILRQGLVAFLKVAFHHEPDQVVVPIGALLNNRSTNIGLIAVVFIRVGMTTIDHYTVIESGLIEQS